MGYQFQSRQTCDRCVRVIHTKMAATLDEAQAELDKAKNEAQSPTFSATFTTSTGEATTVNFATLCSGCVGVIQGHMAEICLKSKPTLKKKDTTEGPATAEPDSQASAETTPAAPKGDSPPAPPPSPDTSPAPSGSKAKAKGTTADGASF